MNAIVYLDWPVYRRMYERLWVEPASMDRRGRNLSRPLRIDRREQYFRHDVWVLQNGKPERVRGMVEVWMDPFIDNSGRWQLSVDGEILQAAEGIGITELNRVWRKGVWILD
jgi:hypothetical protein